jgi:hypothetical protein
MLFFALTVSWEERAAPPRARARSHLSFFAKAKKEIITYFFLSFFLSFFLLGTIATNRKRTLSNR